MIIMTELDNACLYLYSMTSKGLNIKKELVKFVGNILSLGSRNENYRDQEKTNPSKLLILKKYKCIY